ncbi:MAG: hypothetical protein H0W13_04860 [Nitrospirales bacterium]|nr:hypothetical protein [Nitrospirales bacterium]
MAHTPREAAESLYAAMPRAMSLDLLREYGLEVTPEQARHITEEVLSLNLYWIHTALQASLRAGEAERVSSELAQCIARGWKDFDMQGRDHAAAFDEAQKRRVGYDQIVQEGGSPIAVFGESAGSLEFSGVIEAGDRQKLLALFLDVIAVDAFGELIASLELTHS